MSEAKRFALNDDFVAALYDRRFYDKKLDKRKFRDVYRAGFIIQGLYDDAAASPKIKSVLKDLANFIYERQVVLDESCAAVNALFVVMNKELQAKPDRTAHYIPYQWDNKMYLSLVDMILKVDLAFTELTILKINDAIPTKQYWILRKQLANPLRSVIEDVFRVRKRIG
jgi:hypothetical protein